MAQLSKPISVQSQSTLEVAVITVIGVLAIGLSALAREICDPDPALIRWIPFLVFGTCTLGIVLFATLLLADRSIAKAPKKWWQALLIVPIAFFSYLGFQIYDGLNLPANFNTANFLILGIVGAFSLILTFGTFTMVYRTVPKRVQWAQCALILVFSAACLFTSFNFRNVGALVYDLIQRGFWEVILIFLTGAFVWRAVVAPFKLPYLQPKFLTLILTLFSLYLFAALSVRTDRLFEEGSVTHWEFYVGVIRTMRNGGTMLWDAPSQYGYLNLMIASIFPGASAWQSFYLFQATLDFICSALIYFVVRGLLPRNAYNWLLATACAVILFVADSKLIGPQPYPSGSVARFAPVYFLIAYYVYLARTPAVWKRRSTAFSIAALWAFGLFWSSEDGIYATVITVSAVAAWCFVMKKNRGEWALPVKRILAFFIGIVATGVTSIIVYTMAKAGHFPEFGAFLTYGMAYASGFFSLPIPTWGPLWTLAIPILLGTCAALLEMRKPKPDASLIQVVAVISGLWAIFSYYVGRAALDNIIVVFPQLALMLVILTTSRVVNNFKLIKCLAVALTTVSLTYFFTTTFLESTVVANYDHYTGYTSEVMDYLPPAPPDLFAALRQAGVDNDSAIVVHGDHQATLPMRSDWNQLNFGRTWLPTPLAMIEGPIPASRRELVFSRFLENKTQAGFLIEKTGDDEDLFAKIQSELEPYYNAALVAQTREWRIYKYTPKEPSVPKSR